MEVAITESAGVPAGSILSLRAGNTRRQTSVPSAEPLRFPNLPMNARNLKVDLMQSVGTAHLKLDGYDGTGVYSLPVQLSGNTAHLSLRIEEQPAHCGKRSAELKQVDRTETPAMEAAGSQLKVATDTKAYSEAHNLSDAVQELMLEVVSERPEEPFAFIAAFLEAKALEQGETGTADKCRK